MDANLLIFYIFFFLFGLCIGSFLNVVNIAFLWYIWTALIVIFVYDLKHYIIPDKILFPAIIITFSYQLVFNFSLLKHNLIWSGLGSSAFFLVIYLVSRGNWMGFGDVKLAILLGLLLGFPNILLGMFLAFLFGAIIGLGLMIKNKKDLKSQVPFAPFLIVGTFIAMFFGQAIIYWYMNFLILQ